MTEKYVWLTCAGTYREVQEEAMREWFPDAVGNHDYKEIEYKMDDYTDVVAISGNMEESDLDKQEGTEEWDTLAVRLYTIEPDETQEVVDTVEGIEYEDGIDGKEIIDCHIYHTAKEVNGITYHIYYAADVNN